MFHAFGGQSQFNRPNPDTANPNPIRLTIRHFVSQLPSTNNKVRAQLKIRIPCARNLAFAKRHIFGRCFLMSALKFIILKETLKRHYIFSFRFIFMNYVKTF